MTDEPEITTTKELKEVFARITFVNTYLNFEWEFHAKPIITDQTGWLVWASFERPDSITGEVKRGRGREEVVWAGASLSSVVKTAWLLVELLIRHELMEGFRFDGVRIFNPHNSVLALASLQKE